MFLCFLVCFFFFFKQKTAYELRISDWSSDVCSSDLCSTIELYPLDLVRRGLDLGFAARFATPFSHSAPSPRDEADVSFCRPNRFAICASPFSRQRGRRRYPLDRKSVVSGKSVSVSVDLGGRRIIKKKKKKITT